MRHAKKLGGAALFAAAVLLVQAAALAASPSETAASGEAPVYWVGDEARFKALFAGAGPHVHQIIGGADGVFVVFDDNHRVADVAQAGEGGKQSVVVALVEADGGFVQHIHDAG